MMDTPALQLAMSAVKPRPAEAAKIPVRGQQPTA
jgi:hypothetical protein